MIKVGDIEAGALTEAQVEPEVEAMEEEMVHRIHKKNTMEEKVITLLIQIMKTQGKWTTLPMASFVVKIAMNM